MAGKHLRLNTLPIRHSRGKQPCVVLLLLASIMSRPGKVADNHFKRDILLAGLGTLYKIEFLETDIDCVFIGTHLWETLIMVNLDPQQLCRFVPR